MKIKQELSIPLMKFSPELNRPYRKKRISLARLAIGEALVSITKFPSRASLGGWSTPESSCRMSKPAVCCLQPSPPLISSDSPPIMRIGSPLPCLIWFSLPIRPSLNTSPVLPLTGTFMNRTGYKALGQEPTVLVGRMAKAALPCLRRKGVNLIYAEDLEGLEDLPRAENALLAKPYFRVALVAAGIPATILCPRLAKKLRCVAIDYGHVINDLVQPGFTVNDLDRTKRDWRQRKNPPLTE